MANMCAQAEAAEASGDKPVNLRRILLAGAIAAGSLPASADDIGAARSFTPEDFARFAPTSALDMVEAVPGFVIESGNTGARGLGQASANVLINGERVAGKSTSVFDVLARIPARSVTRIDLLDGTALQVPGLSGQVVNVIARTDGVAGTWTWNARLRENLPPYYDDLEVSVTGRRGDLEWTLGAESSPGRAANRGSERVLDGAGTLVERREEDYTRVSVQPGLSASLAWTPPSGLRANLNAEAALFQMEERETSRQFPLDGRPDGQRVFRGAEDEWNAELGGDIAFDAGPGRLKLIAVARQEHSPFVSQVVEGANDGSVFARSRFEQTVDEAEYILRGEYGLTSARGVDWQLAAEGALNTLDAESRLFVAEGDAPLGEIGLASPETRVEERRAEVNLTHGRTLSERLSFQVSLGAEVSEISAEGAAARTFTRPKGFVSAAWEAGDDLTVTARLERSVGQLDFFDFVSSLDLDDGDADTGNPDIVPDQRWTADLELDRNLGAHGAATLTIYGSLIEDIVDRVPIGARGEGPGNIDRAESYGARLESTLLFDPLGWKGAQLELDGEYRQTGLDDPVTGERRRISDSRVWSYFAELRHDVPGTAWAWGVGVEEDRQAPRYRLSQIRDQENTPGFGFVFVQHKDIAGLTGTVIIGNVLDQDDQATRTFFAPRRGGTRVRVEDSTRNFGPFLSFRVEGTF